MWPRLGDGRDHQLAAVIGLGVQLHVHDQAQGHVPESTVANTGTVSRPIQTLPDGALLQVAPPPEQTWQNRNFEP